MNSAVSRKIRIPFELNAGGHRRLRRYGRALATVTLTRSRAAKGNVPTALNALYYAQRASAGLIISEATQISPQGQGYIATPGIHSAEQISSWSLVTKAVHAAGGHMVLQLWHVGRISQPSFQPGGGLPVAPSAIRPEAQAFTERGFEPIPTPRALGTEEISGIVEEYAQAARTSPPASTVSRCMPPTAT